MTEYPPSGPAAAEPKALRHYLENLTFISLWLAVSLYFIGQIQSWKFLQAFQIPNTGVERSWETCVFLGAVALINEVPNLLLAPSAQVLKWVVPLLLFAGSAWGWKRMSPPRGGLVQRFGRGLLLVVSGLAYIVFLVSIGAGWGTRSAQLFKRSPGTPERFVLTPESRDLFPPGFTEANARGGLQHITSSVESTFVYDPAHDVTYALPNRLVVCRVFVPAPPSHP